MLINPTGSVSSWMRTTVLDTPPPADRGPGQERHLAVRRPKQAVSGNPAPKRLIAGVDVGHAAPGPRAPGVEVLMAVTGHLVSVLNDPIDARRVAWGDFDLEHEGINVIPAASTDHALDPTFIWRRDGFYPLDKSSD